VKESIFLIHIFGVDHWLQEYELWTRKEYVLGEPSQEELEYRRASKTRFYGIIENLIKTNNFAILGEECSPNQDTIPRRLAEENNLRYLEIDMNQEERDSAGIVPKYQAVPETEMGGYRLREDHMFSKTKGALSDDQDALLVCGANHVEGLRRRFETNRFAVITHDISEEEWAENPIKRAFRGGFGS
jgi:hypothetical protein